MAVKKKSKKKKDLKIQLRCTEGTGHFYTVLKSACKESTAGKLILKKYNPKLRKHVDYKETKIKK
ncbi:MAG: 50S ribosomal protein L33 [marine bacterium B5-7]|nr:MAG: 50S ribosomal protein L33 [marine bacterium B5-7]